MSKKVYELANEYHIPSLELVERLRAWGYKIRNHMEVVNSSLEHRIRDYFRDFRGRRAALRKSPKTVLRKNPASPQILIKEETSATLEKILPSSGWDEIRLKCYIAESQKSWKFSDMTEYCWQTKQIQNNG